MALTVKRVDRLVREGAPGRHLDSAGLYLVVASPAAAHWELRFQIRHRLRWMGLGSARVFSLDEARARARAARQQLADGVDPLEARRGERAAQAAAAAKVMTFAEAARTYHRQHEGKWRNRKHAAQFLSTLRDYVFPIFGELPIAAVDTGLVLKVLEQRVDGGSLWTERTETASRVRGRVEAVLAWAAVRGYRSGDNPARWKGHLAEVMPARGKVAKVEHHAALPYRDLPEFMAELRTREGVAARALEFTILTAARTGEAIGARWDEIADGVWTIPAGRMKGGKEHRLPLPARAVELLASLYREGGNGHVFIGSKAGAGLSNMSLTAVLRRMGRGDITVHGFRSTFRDWAAEQTNFPREVAEMALAHAIGSKVEAAYRRGDLFAKRRQLSEAWGRYCTGAPVQDAENVVPMRGVP